MNFIPVCTPPLPVSWKECRQRGWTSLDILLVTGDHYVDHPSFGVALIGRLLEKQGYKVAILSQPHTNSPADFRAFPSPALFCGISAGNLDSIVANYSGNGKIRDKDPFSADGNPWRGTKREKSQRRRPDRASIIYTALARAAFPGTPMVLGGIECSLRRFIHYDFKQQKLRASVLTDAKGDILVYGMAEKAILEIAERLSLGTTLTGINGTCLRLTDNELNALSDRFPPVSSKTQLVLPSWHEISGSKQLFLSSEIVIDKTLRSAADRLIIQKQQSHWVLQFPPTSPLSSEELDRLYELPYTRQPHPAATVPAHTMIRDSVTIVRGCSGNCSFCAITRHQGAATTSRSLPSVLTESRSIAGKKGFRGTISDLGGPTANLFATHCKIGTCKKKDCLYPKLCPNLQIDENQFLKLLKEVSAIPGVKKVFISSGMRMELLLQTPRLLEQILRKHTPGLLKIAPEHTDDGLLALMHKEPHSLLKRFIAQCKKIDKKHQEGGIRISPYIIISHPGSTVDHAEKLVRDLKKIGLQSKKFQDFTPSPGTLSTAMYFTGLRADTMQPIPIAKQHSERKKEREVLETAFHPKNISFRKQPIKKRGRG